MLTPVSRSLTRGARPRAASDAARKLDQQCWVTVSHTGQFFNCSFVNSSTNGSVCVCSQENALVNSIFALAGMILFINGVRVGKEYMILNSAIFIPPPFFFCCTKAHWV